MYLRDGALFGGVAEDVLEAEEAEGLEGRVLDGAGAEWVVPELRVAVGRGEPDARDVDVVGRRRAHEPRVRTTFKLTQKKPA